MIRESISFIRNYDFFSKRIFLASMFVLGIYYLYWDFVPSTFSNLIATGIYLQNRLSDMTLKGLSLLCELFD